MAHYCLELFNTQNSLYTAFLTLISNNNYSLFFNTTVGKRTFKYKWQWSYRCFFYSISLYCLYTISTTASNCFVNIVAEYNEEEVKINGERAHITFSSRGNIFKTIEVSNFSGASSWYNINMRFRVKFFIYIISHCSFKKQFDALKTLYGHFNWILITILSVFGFDLLKKYNAKRVVSM